jgi:phage gpG-like protein
MATTGIDEVAQAIENLTFKEPLEEVRELLRSETEIGFQTETDPDGNKWPELKPQTIKRKLRRAKRERHQSRNKILQDKGDLADSLLVKPRTTGTVEELSESTLDWGTEIPYGWFHTEGTKHMPKREFVGVSESAADRIEDILADHVEKVICGS